MNSDRDPDAAPALGTVLTDAQWPAEIADLRQGFAGALNVYRAMAHSPALLRAWAPLRNYLVLESALPKSLSEIVILRVGHRWGSDYEWGQHVIRGRAAGLDDARIDAARHPPQGDGTDALLIRAVDQLLDEGHLQPQLVIALQSRLPGAAVIDLMATVGMYTTLAFILRTFSTQLEPAMQAALNARPLAP